MELICFMNIFYRYGKQLLEGMLTDLDVNMQELIVMLVMHQSPGILQSRLLHFTGLDKGNFSKFLKQLEEKIIFIVRLVGRRQARTSVT